MKYTYREIMLIFTILASSTLATIIHVPDDYPTIQQGIDHSGTGDTVMVASGTYFENVVINQAIHLLGESRYTTIIDGSGLGDVVTIRANRALISFFTVRNGGLADTNSGVKFDACDSSSIRSCLILYNKNGIILRGATFDTIRFCRIDSNEIGINLLENRAAPRQITSNDFLNNVIENNSNVGICFNYTGTYNHSGNDIIGNRIEGNGLGIGMINSQENQIWYNDFIANIGYAISISMSFGGGEDNYFLNNAFHDNHTNSVQAYDMFGNNHWSALYWGERFGNYWSDYVGADTDGNGFGDIPYEIAGGQTSDHNPLMVAPKAYILGSVRDELGQGIPDVNIEVIGTSIHTTSQPNGNIRIMGLGTGFWRISLAKTGYRDTIIEDIPAFLTTWNSIRVIMRPVSGIDNPTATLLPQEMRLLQNYPNPFNSNTNIRFELATESQIKIGVYNILGQEVTTVYNGKLSAGSHDILFNAAQFPSGPYFCRLDAGNRHSVRKMLLIK